MADERSNDQNFSVSVPLTALAVGALLALGAAAYLMSTKNEADVGSALKEKSKAGKGFGRKLGLMTLITLIENDATRRVVVAILRAMARRA